MAHLARVALLALVVPFLLVVGSQRATAGGTVVFSPGDATSVQDGRTLCVIGTSDRGRGSVICSGRAVYDALWAGTACDSMTRMGCIKDGRIRGVRLSDSGRPQRAWIAGLGGSTDVQRGQRIRAGRITGKRLDGGGFRFVNRSGHGFRLTDGAFVAR
jgi:hypothetical protein